MANDEQADEVLRTRGEVPIGDTWDLSSLFASDSDWERALAAWEARIPAFEAFAGTLATSPEALAACLDDDLRVERDGDRLATYAHLRASEDQAAPDPQQMMGRYRHVATSFAAKASFLLPEILAIPAATLDAWLRLPVLAPHRISLERIVRTRPHVLSEREERILAMQGTFAGTAAKVFRQLTDADMKFGTVVDGRGRRVELSNATFTTILLDPDGGVRRNAFLRFYEQYEAHANTLAATLSGSMERDVYAARVRNHASAVDAALFADNIPLAVYDQLIAAVRAHLPTVHRYYDLRRRLLGLEKIHQYDCYVPLGVDEPQRHTWDDAVGLVVGALQPLGPDYCRRLDAGLRGRWCDRYPNAGKQSGAFSSGTYDSDPYILMNYQDEGVEHVFTLAHEAGHSMHTRFSAEAQPYQLAGYTIFVAEVASTFNEQFLARALLERAQSPRERAAILAREIDGIRNTIVRQTMFAEFERLAHASAEAGQPLTLERIRGIYRGLLDAYFGPGVEIDPQLELECLRIPHFYNAFYVYKYATGLSAAIALADRVATGGQAELDAYLGFLRGGCSRWPLELLRDAGVDLERPEPVATALGRFGQLVDELERTLLG